MYLSAAVTPFPPATRTGTPCTANCLISGPSVEILFSVPKPSLYAFRRLSTTGAGVVQFVPYIQTVRLYLAETYFPPKPCHREYFRPSRYPPRVVENFCHTARHSSPPDTNPDADPGRTSCGSRADSTTCWCPGVGPAGRRGPRPYSSVCFSDFFTPLSWAC